MVRANHMTRYALTTCVLENIITRMFFKLARSNLERCSLVNKALESRVKGRLPQTGDSKSLPPGITDLFLTLFYHLLLPQPLFAFSSLIPDISLSTNASNTFLWMNFFCLQKFTHIRWNSWQMKNDGWNWENVQQKNVHQILWEIRTQKWSAREHNITLCFFQTKQFLCSI